MIEYDRQNWLKSVLSFRGTALRHAWGRIFAVTAYSVATQAIYETAVAHGNLNLQAVFANLPPTIHAVLGTLLGFLIVFRLNASNDRYWEGRSSWGQIINCSRNLVR